MDAQQQTEYIFNPKLLLSDIHVGFQSWLILNSLDWLLLSEH